MLSKRSGTKFSPFSSVAIKKSRYPLLSMASSSFPKAPWSSRKNTHYQKRGRPPFALGSVSKRIPLQFHSAKLDPVKTCCYAGSFQIKWVDEHHASLHRNPATAMQKKNVFLHKCQRKGIKYDNTCFLQ